MKSNEENGATRGPTNQLVKHLKRHRIDQLPGLTQTLVEVAPDEAMSLASRIINANGFIAMPQPQPGHVWIQVPAQAEES